MAVRAPLAVGLAAVVGLAVTANPGDADWLVLRDGVRVETRGPGEARGKLLVFTGADGRLSSLRLDDVDLEASHKATKAAARALAEPPAKPPARQTREPAFVLTDDDVRHSQPSPSAAASEGALTPGVGPGTEEPPQGTPAGDTASGVAKTSGSTELVVTQWQEGSMPDDGGLRISGSLQNRGGTAATRVRLTALVYDREGALITTAGAQLSTNVLMPDRQARFQVDLPGVFDFASVRFDPSSLDFEAGSPLGEPPSGSDGDGSKPQ